MRENWTYKKLGEVCEIEYGTRVVQARDGGSIYPVYGGGGATFMMDTYNRENRVVVSRFAMSKKCTRKVIGKFFLNDSGLTIKSKEPLLLQNYLDTFILSSNDKIYHLGRGLAQKNLKVPDLLQIDIAIPNAEVQQSIVAELDKINEQISLKKAQLSDLDSLVQSIFYDMFGDPIENEKGWEVKKLGEVVNITAKLVDPNQQPYCNQYHVGPANIIGGTGEIVDCLIAKDENLISGKYAFKSGVVLYSKIRPNLNKVAMPSFDGVCSADMYPLSMKANVVNMYIMRLLMTKEFLKYAVNCSGRARMPKINREALFDFRFYLPPLALQQDFAKRIELIEQQKAQISSTIKDLETLLASRMQYWFD